MYVMYTLLLQQAFPAKQPLYLPETKDIERPTTTFSTDPQYLT
jgi:hypothetical protein